MQIVKRHNKYYLQFDNGELELSEQQVQKRLSRGDKMMNQLQTLEEDLPKIEGNVKISKKNVENGGGFSSNSYASAKYFDHIIHEFEQIYLANTDDPQALDKLRRFCKNSIQKLERDRKSPKTDHVVIDYYLLAWNRVLNFIDTLPEKIKSKEHISVVSPAKENIAVANNNDISKETTPVLKDHTKQLLIIQLMQAEGIFPINNALEDVTQTDIQKLISGILGIEDLSASQALHHASAILLKRNITLENIADRIRILEETEAFFEELPYANIISRVKLLLKIYREKLPR